MTASLKRIGLFGSYLFHVSVADLFVLLGVVGMFLSVALTISTQNSHLPGAMAGGTGTKDDPYLIENCEHLQNVAKVPKGYYKLAHNIDCLTTSYSKNGLGFMPIGYYGYGFSGTFDGDGHTISNLYVQRPDQDYVGLFGKLDNGAVVKNVTLTVDLLGRDNVGGLVGWVVGGTITNVNVTGAVRGRNGVGGVSGVNQGVLKNASTSVQVEAYGNWAGGITGWNYSDAEIDGAWVADDVSGDRFVGGVAGVSHNATMRNVTVSADVTGNTSVGGITGYLVGESGQQSVLYICEFSGDVYGGVGASDIIGKLDGFYDVDECYVVSEVEAQQPAESEVDTEEATEA